MSSIVNDYLRQIKAAQKVCRTAGDIAGAVTAYNALLVELLNKLEALSPSERMATLEDATGEGIGLLLGAAHGGAIWAIREKRAEYLRNGIRAIMLLIGKEDFRELLIILTLLDNSAQKLGVSLYGIYTDVKQKHGYGTSDLLDNYFDGGGKTIADMGYVESCDKDGKFTYSRIW